MAYYFEDHTADIMIVVDSNSLLNFFNDLLEALWQIFLSKNEDQDFIEKKIEFQINFDNNEELVFNFLSKYVYLFEVERFVMREVEKVEIVQKNALFLVKGFWVRKIVSFIKAPTYHNFEVDFRRSLPSGNGYYRCRVVLDV